jgi:YidC/Oxa1 family membrane protein insertase
LYTRTDASTYILCFVSILSFGNKFETKGFLWADDLSSLTLFMSYHFMFQQHMEVISLFPILASIAIFFYMTTGDQQMAAPQEGMPIWQK